MQESRNNTYRTTVGFLFSVALSFILFYVGFGQIFFVLPLLMVGVYHKRALSFLALAVETVAVVSYAVATSLYPEHMPEIALPLILIELYIPLSLLAAGAVWLLTRERRVEIRLAGSMLPAVVFFILLFVYLEHDKALLDGVRTYYENVFGVLLPGLLGVTGMSEDFMEMFFSILFSVVLSVLLPLVMCFVCATCFSYETVLHSRESDWEDKVASVELDGRLIWLFIALWAVVLFSRFVSLPYQLGIALINLALCVSIAYAVQGFSVVYYKLRIRGRKLRSYSLFLVLAAVAIFVPGINFIIVLGLPLLGVAETFFELRR